METLIKTAKINKYPAYKSSGVEWIGEIPEHWETINFRYLIRILTDYTANGSFADLGKNVTYLDSPSYSRLVRLTDLRKNLENNGVYLNEQSHKYLKKSELFGEELLLANVGAYAGLAWLMPVINYKASLAPNMFLIKLEKDTLTKYIYYLINSILYNNYLQEIAKSAAQPKLNKDNIRQLRIILPPLSEQTAIANFLDQKTQDLDTAISQKQNLITLLEERKQIIIQDAVTKGITKNVELKESGIEWIGKIPKHWEVKKLKYCDSVNMGQSPDSNDVNMDEIGLPFIQGNAEFGKQFPTPKLWCTRPNKVALNNDILLSVRAPVGAVNFANTKIGIGRGLCAITAKKTNLEFLYYSIIIYEKKLNSISTGSTFKAISVSDVKNIKLVVPPLSEQQQIVSHIESASKKIDEAISLQKKQIKKLKEYKSVLIDAAVTGKIKV